MRGEMFGVQIIQTENVFTTSLAVHFFCERTISPYWKLLFHYRSEGRCIQVRSSNLHHGDCYVFFV